MAYICIRFGGECDGCGQCQEENNNNDEDEREDKESE